MPDMQNLSTDKNKKLLQEELITADTAPHSYRQSTLDTFMHGHDAELSEVYRFSEWRETIQNANEYTFEIPHKAAQRPQVELLKGNGESLTVLNLSSFNYLGYGYHPEVISAAKAALDIYGLGASSSPVLSGTMVLHKQLEERLVEFLGRPQNGVSLFSSGYSVNLGTISAIMKPGSHVIMDRAMHMSAIEGAQLSGATVHVFRHNDVDHLHEILKDIHMNGRRRTMICVEGVYSADGDFGQLAQIVEVARLYGAMVLVDEAHSVLLHGPHGRGVAAAQSVLNDIDFFVMTFSKALGGVGGALIAKKEITQYINWFARCRMFSCAIDPATTGGVLKALELGAGPDGERRRQQLHTNAAYLRSLLKGKVNIGESESWIIPVIYGSQHLTLPLNQYIQQQGLETSIMQFPAVPKHATRMRCFVTSEHTFEQLEAAAEIILKAATRFEFIKD